MRTVQMTLDVKLVAAVDRTARKLRTSRSAFTRKALRLALSNLRVEELERRHRRGYTERPAMAGEFDAWESEQVWPD